MSESTNMYTEDDYQKLEFQLALSESDCDRIRNDAIRLADALMDIYNVIGEEEHVKIYVSEVDSIMREYHAMDVE